MSDIEIISHERCDKCDNFIIFTFYNSSRDETAGICIKCGELCSYEGAMDTYLIEDKSEVKTEVIKSDGGKSDYYEVTVNGHKFMIEDMIDQVFGNDFDRGNILKALVRVNALIKGGGKEGSSVKYETSKIKYYANRVYKSNE